MPTPKKFLLTRIDYFSKWVDAQAYSSIKDKDAMKFLWKNIMCQFGILWAIMSNNGPQFDTSTYRNFYKGLGIKNFYFTPQYSAV